jgi:hypothetical protein
LKLFTRDELSKIVFCIFTLSHYHRRRRCVVEISLTTIHNSSLTHSSTPNFLQLLPATSDFY